MQLIDSHCHLDFEQFDEDRATILKCCAELGVNQIIVPGVTAERWPHLLMICQQSKMLHPALGLHPLFMQQHQPHHLPYLQHMIDSNSVIAIGEIGLDFYSPQHDKAGQIDLLIAQLRIAQIAELPVILHVRKAHDQIISLLKDHPVKGGIVHAFNGSLQQAHQYKKLGFLLGVGGAYTYAKATRLQSLIGQLPLSSIALETDAPDMLPEGASSQRNTPENIPKILDVIASLRSETNIDIAHTTSENCKRLFAI